MEIHVKSLAEFKEAIKEGEKVLVDFYAEWCGPCRMLSPVIETVAREHAELKVIKVDVDENPDIAGLFQVQAIPTLLLYENGELKNRITNYLPKPALLSFLGY